jgi:hypothetical protein
MFVGCSEAGVTLHIDNSYTIQIHCAVHEIFAASGQKGDLQALTRDQLHQTSAWLAAVVGQPMCPR